MTRQYSVGVASGRRCANSVAAARNNTSRITIAVAYSIDDCGSPRAYCRGRF